MKYILTLISCTTIGVCAEGGIGGVTYFDFVKLDDSTAFNFQRQYFSYSVIMNDDVSIKVLFDVGRNNTTDTRLNTFLKKAQIDYKTTYCTVSFGMIGMNTYGVQEGNWGYRFIEKSSVDKYGLSSTADLGVGISKLIMENLNMSLQATNGEGYKKPQGDKYHKISFNATYGTRNLNTSNGYNAGVVYSTESTDSDPTRMISTFGGISKMRLRVGAEYDIYTKAGNYEANIISISSNYAVTEKIAAYVRYDMWDDNHAEEKNGKYYLLFGVLINCSNGLSVSPNMKLAYYEDSSISSGNEYKVNFKFQF